MSCAAVVPKDLGDWAGTAEFVLGAGSTGKDLKDVSAMDKARAQDRTGAIACRQGLGTLIAKLGEQMPLALSTPASRSPGAGGTSRWKRPPAGSPRVPPSLRYQATCWPQVASGSRPTCPKRQLDAAAKLSLGSYDHIALQLPGNPLGLARDEILIEQSNSTQTALMFANRAGSALCIIDVAGSFGRDLAAQGAPAMTAFAKEWLTKLFGSEPFRGSGNPA